MRLKASVIRGGFFDAETQRRRENQDKNNVFFSASSSATLRLCVDRTFRPTFRT
jgi:hypothetical protein